MTKVTLSMEKTILQEAKKLAKARKTSVSAMISHFVHFAANAEGLPSKIGPLTRKVTGIGKLPPDKDYKELLTDALMEKYGLDR